MADTDLIRIGSGRLSAAINPFGAELTSLTDADGRELMTNADPAFWTGRAPILFPIVGALACDTLRVDGTAYSMKKHGFARRSRFDVTDQGAAHARFVLVDDEGTRAVYPFAFRLVIDFRVEDATLAVAAAIENPAGEPLPASFGFHPAFAWPLPYGKERADHRIVFATDEPDTLRRIAADGTIAASTRTSPLDGRTLHLRDDLFADDALVWDHVRSDRVSYSAPAGPQLEIAFSDTPMLGIWTKPGARFVCVEPWHGIADPEGFTGEFRDKPGVFEVPPGETRRIGMTVALKA